MIYKTQRKLQNAVPFSTVSQGLRKVVDLWDRLSGYHAAGIDALANFLPTLKRLGALFELSWTMPAQLPPGPWTTMMRRRS